MSRELTEQSEKAPTSAVSQPMYSLFNEAYSDHLKVLPNIPARPGDPHYVGQAEWDTTHGLLDLNSGHFSQGESDVKSAVKDLTTEEKLINTAQSAGNKISQDITGGNAKSAEDQLTEIINKLQGNHFNSADSQDFANARTALEYGNSAQAKADVVLAEQTLTDRSNQVTTAQGDLKSGLNEFNSDMWGAGEKEMKAAMQELHQKAILPPPPPGTATPA